MVNLELSSTALARSIDDKRSSDGAREANRVVGEIDPNQHLSHPIARLIACRRDHIVQPRGTRGGDPSSACRGRRHHHRHENEHSRH